MQLSTSKQTQTAVRQTREAYVKLEAMSKQLRGSVTQNTNTNSQAVKRQYATHKQALPGCKRSTRKTQRRTPGL